ncbi:Protein downstream neighbor of son [Blattella germanica]|nr:Protein downstream neighbor of son [Blattella germanica]
MDDPESSAPVSPSWKRPDEVMKLHRLKVKQRALQARFNKSLPRTPEKNQCNTSREIQNQEDNNEKRNPFRCNMRKRPRYDEDAHSVSLDPSSDNTLFQLFNSSSGPRTNFENIQTSFTSVLSHIIGKEKRTELVNSTKGADFIPLDWTLKTKIRFISRNPFGCTQKLLTCEEASGITGFVRCLDTGLDASGNSDAPRSLDTSLNARFHQCCLIWQHPALPWIELFPRSSARLSAASNIIASSQMIKDSLHREWSESFRSLFQLTRAGQCPYFYVCANTFTCLFRAAGILGFAEIHALLTPTTRGFRQVLKEEDVEFTMPLKKSSQPSTKRLSSDSAGDTGYNTMDSVHDESSVSGHYVDDIDVELNDDDEDEPADEWLESMGIAAEEIKKIKSKQTKVEHDKQRVVDRTPESLIYVEGVEAQALFNFLMNCKSSIAPTGPLAGIPPTLLAPVAFSGSTLKPLKVRQSVVKMGMENYHSMELRGPILPHTVHNLCGLLERNVDEFSATFANLDSTRPFSMVTEMPEPKTEENEPPASTMSPEKSNSSTSTVRTPTKVPSAFGTQNLSDCGLQPSVLQRFCSSDANRIHVLDSLKLSSDSSYMWT